MKSEIKTRNWHAVNAFQRHAGSMNSIKRENKSAKRSSVKSIIIHTNSKNCQCDDCYDTN